ncbi:MAG TPA: hypothetical protein VKB79_29760 [Bryobacteraceae bacterium]|nr:hypothetical protein [Bryobacteraceae bacterium]
MHRIVTVFAVFAAVCSADTVTLRNGQIVQGTYLGGTARQIRVDVNGSIQTFDVGQVQSVSFMDNGYASAPPAPAPPAESYHGDRGVGYAQAPPAPQPPPPGGLGVTIPTDTAITVRMIDSVNSDTARLGQTYRASLDEPLFINGQQVVPRGADVMTKLVADEKSGKIQGRAALTLALVSINVNGQSVPVTSTDVRTESSSRGARSAGVIGGGTALGAIVGALAGGGKGAAIGAASGAAVGTGAEVLTKGQTVKIPSETRLTFRLQSSIQL